MPTNYVWAVGLLFAMAPNKKDLLLHEALFLTLTLTLTLALTLALTIRYLTREESCHLGY